MRRCNHGNHQNNKEENGNVLLVLTVNHLLFRNDHMFGSFRLNQYFQLLDRGERCIRLCFGEVDDFQTGDGDQQWKYGKPVSNDDNDIHCEVMKRNHSIYNMKSGTSTTNVNAKAEEGAKEQTQCIT